MTTPLLRVCWLSLKRDRVALMLTFVLPIAFFSIFALVFGGMGGDATSRIRVAVADLDGTEESRRLAEALAEEPALRVTFTAGDPPRPLDREAALEMVRDGDVPAAIVLLPGFGESFGNFLTSSPKVELLHDRSDPVAAPMVSGLLQKVAMMAAPDLLATRGLDLFEQYAGPLTPTQRAAVDRFEVLLRQQSLGGRADEGDPASAEPVNDAGAPDEEGRTADTASDQETAAQATDSEGAPTFSGPVAVEVVDVLGESKGGGIVAFYAAATAVMFLLFAMSGAAGTLLEEEEAGTLERVLASGVGIRKLLSAKWVFYALIGVVQVTVMFVWGSLVFGIDLLGHLPGFTILTFATAGAAAAFGLVLAALCRTRAQLAGLSTIVILIMSAVGGSMFPRFLMPEWMQTVGLATFNAWALDGYQKVFWYEQPLTALWPQVTVLALLTAVLLAIACWLGRRWQTA